MNIRGYVANVSSPTIFESEDYRITRDFTLVLEMEKQDGQEGIQFRPEDIRVVVELDEASGALHARSIKVFLDDNRRIKRTALIQRVPDLKNEDEGWAEKACRWREHHHKSYCQCFI